jgi:hypothetical protein
MRSMRTMVQLSPASAATKRAMTSSYMTALLSVLGPPVGPPKAVTRRDTAPVKGLPEAIATRRAARTRARALGGRRVAMPLTARPGAVAGLGGGATGVGGALTAHRLLAHRTRGASFAPPSARVAELVTDPADGDSQKWCRPVTSAQTTRNPQGDFRSRRRL